MRCATCKTDTYLTLQDASDHPDGFDETYHCSGCDSLGWYRPRLYTHGDEHIMEGCLESRFDGGDSA